MNFSLFYHSLVSDWNHGNAHFLRGVASELIDRGHTVRVFEPRNGWSRNNLLAEHTVDAVEDFHRAFPRLTSEQYDSIGGDIPAALEGTDVVIVHEWTDPVVISRIAQHRTREGKYCLLFHDTHHRAVSDPDALAMMGLERFDGVLAFGASLAEQYRAVGWGRRVWVWHEAADLRITQTAQQITQRARQITQTGRPQITQITQITPISQVGSLGAQPSLAAPQGRLAATEGDLVWVGNWGDDERARELNEYLLEPARRLQLKARVHGVRYPDDALASLRAAGIEYAGWVPNYQVPDVFSRFRVTVHIPRRPYVSLLPGIPTIRVFEALACGIPLVSAPWDDCEKLFRPGDFLMAHGAGEMTAALERVVQDAAFAAELTARGLETIYARHTCAHRVDELLAIIESLRPRTGPTHDRAPILETTVSETTHAATVSGSRASRPRAAFFGSSILSAYWNGAATYYRGIVRELHRHGVDVTFYEPDAYDRQQHRDLEPPDWVTSVVYPATPDGVERALESARGADFVVKTSGVGVFDEMLDAAVLDIAPGRAIYWDVDAPATLARVQKDAADPFRRAIPQYALIFTYGGGPPVVHAYTSLGARACVPIYNAVDVQTHHPVQHEERFAADLNLLVNRLPDRELRIEEFFFKPARALSSRRFTLGGNGWAGKDVPGNVRLVGHVYTADHNRFNCSSLAVLSVNREDMARTGYSPATRVFEATGAGACLISDAWTGLDEFFDPELEILSATGGNAVVEHLESLTPARAARIGRAAYRRTLAEHTYAHRVAQVLRALAIVPNVRAGVGV